MVLKAEKTQPDVSSRKTKSLDNTKYCDTVSHKLSREAIE